MKHLQVDNGNPDEEKRSEKKQKSNLCSIPGERTSEKGRVCRYSTWWNLADGSRVPAIALVTVGGLHEDCAVTEALCEDLPSDVVQPHATP